MLDGDDKYYKWSPLAKHLTAMNQNFIIEFILIFLLPFPTVPTFRWLLKVLWNTQTNNISLGAQSQPQPRRDVQDIRKEPFFQIKSFFNTNKVKVKTITENETKAQTILKFKSKMNVKVKVNLSSDARCARYIRWKPFLKIKSLLKKIKIKVKVKINLTPDAMCRISGENHSHRSNPIPRK